RLDGASVPFQDPRLEIGKVRPRIEKLQRLVQAEPQPVDRQAVRRPLPVVARPGLACRAGGARPQPMEMRYSQQPGGRLRIRRCRDRTPAAHPHTSRATSTMRRSLAFSSSMVSALPSTVDEKPHCGLRHNCSSGTYLAASSMRRFNSSLLSSAARLVVTRPSTTFFGPLGTKRNGAKPPERASSYSRKKPSTLSSPNKASATWS